MSGHQTTAAFEKRRKKNNACEVSKRAALVPPLSTFLLKFNFLL